MVLIVQAQSNKGRSLWSLELLGLRPDQYNGRGDWSPGGKCWAPREVNWRVVTITPAYVSVSLACGCFPQVPRISPPVQNVPSQRERPIRLWILWCPGSSSSNIQHQSQIGTLDWLQDTWKNYLRRCLRREKKKIVKKKSWNVGAWLKKHTSSRGKDWGGG